MHITLQAIYQYPVKSLAGIKAQSAVIEPQGLTQDRRWLITDSKGRFLTARRFPSMLLWKTRIDAHDNLTLISPNGDTQTVSAAHCSRMQQVTVWRDTFTAYKAPDPVNTWLSENFAIPCQLYYLGQQSHRPLKDHPNKDCTGQLSFADSAPFMLTTQPSLDALNQQLCQPVSMNRFRPNFVVSGELAAWVEDKWRNIRIGDVRFAFYAYCTRCKMININVNTATPSLDNQPLKTLQSSHFSAKEPVFGIHLVAKNTGTVRVNDRIIVE